MSAAVKSEVYASMIPVPSAAWVKPEVYATLLQKKEITIKPEVYASMIPSGESYIKPEVYLSIIKEPAIKLCVWHDGKPYTCKLTFDEAVLAAIRGGS